MNDEKRIDALERSFDIMEEIIETKIVNDEEKTRANIKNDIARRLKETNDPDERWAIMHAYQRLHKCTQDELFELAESALTDYGDFDDDEFLERRMRILKAPIGTTMTLQRGNGEYGEFEIRMRFDYKDGKYLFLLDLSDQQDNGCYAVVFYRFFMGIEPKNDAFLRVNDEQLENELVDYAMKLLEEEGGDEDED